MAPTAVLSLLLQWWLPAQRGSAKGAWESAWSSYFNEADLSDATKEAVNAGEIKWK